MRTAARDILRLARELVAGETLLATNGSYWSWDYDANDREAKVFVDDRENLRLEITETHRKSGLGAGERRAVLEDVSLGTLSKPKLALVQGLLKKHGHERSGAGGPFSRTWTVPGTRDQTSLSEILRAKAVELGVAPESERVPQASPEERRRLLMDFVRSMKPDEVEKALAAVVGR